MLINFLLRIINDLVEKGPIKYLDFEIFISTVNKTQQEISI